MSQVVSVKEEPLGQDMKEEQEDVEREALALLYAKHEIKEELVLGPEGFQRPAVGSAILTRSTMEQNRPEACCYIPDYLIADDALIINLNPDDHYLPRACSVKLERINEKLIDPKYKIYTQKSNITSKTSCRTQNSFLSCFVRLERIRIHDNLCNNKNIIIKRPRSRIHHDFRSCFVNLEKIEIDKLLDNKQSIKSSNCIQDAFLSCFVKLEKIQINEYLIDHNKNITNNSSVLKMNPKSEKNAKFENNFGNKVGNIGQNTQSCEMCGKQFKLKNLRKHQRRAHSVRRYKCNVCNKRFAEPSALKMHKMIHLDIKPYPCDMCDKQYTHKIHLIAHSKTHSKPYACHKCGCRFHTEAQLLRHNQPPLGNIIRICDYCGKEFTSRQSLVIHFRTHTGEKPFTCEICTRPFADSSALIRHVRLHTGHKPFACEVCGKRFPGKGPLSVHALTHTDEKSSRATFVGNAFSESRICNAILEFTQEKNHMCVRIVINGFLITARRISI